MTSTMMQNWGKNYIDLTPVKKRKKRMYAEELMDSGIESAEGDVFQERFRPQLAHSYVPGQIYELAFFPGEALEKGTLFPELWGVYPIPE